MASTQPTTRATAVDPTRYGLPARPMVDLSEVADAMEVASKQKVNLLTPLTSLTYIPPQHQMAIRMVFFDPGGQWNNRTNGTWYEIEGSSNIALHRPALRMLASAAGLSYITERVDDRSQQFYWCYRAMGRLKSTDGQFRTLTATKELELYEGGGEYEEMWRAAKKRSDPNKRDATTQIFKARQVGSRLCESKAINALVRDALGLRGSYTKQEALLPFVFPVLIWTPDMDDPEIRRMTTAAELGIVKDVYGGRGSADVIRAPLRQIEAPPPQTRLPAQKTPAPAGPPPDGGAPPIGDVLDIEGAEDPPFEFACSECGVEITERVASFSTDKYGKMLCFDDQKKRQ